MKRSLMVALVLGLTLGIAGAANAALITSVVDVNSTVTGSGYLNWSHDNIDPDFSVPPDTVNWAKLRIEGFGVNGNNDRVFIDETVDLRLGPLTKGIHSFTVFGVTQYFREGWGSGDAFNVTFLYREVPVNVNYLTIGHSTLTIDYTNHESNGASPVPEPGTMMLLGSGLVGMAIWGRKKFRK